MVLGFQKGAEPGRKAVESSRNGAEHDFETCYVHLLTFPGGMPRFSETDFDELSFGTYVELRYYPRLMSNFTTPENGCMRSVFFSGVNW